MVSEPTCRALCCRCAICLSGVRTYLPDTVLQGNSLFKGCWNLPAWHCVAGKHAVLVVSEPTCLALCYRGAGSLCGVRTYLLGTVLQGHRLLKWCSNLPAWHCVAGVQAVQAVSEPTCWALCCRGAIFLSGVRTYLPDTVLQGNSLFKGCWNLPAWHCVAEKQAILVVSEPTCLALCYRGAGCSNSVRTYLPGTVLQRCRLLKRCWNLPA